MINPTAPPLSPVAPHRSSTLWLMRFGAAAITYTIAAGRLPALSERVYVVIPILFAFEAVIFALRRERAALRRRLVVCGVGVSVLALAAVINRLGWVAGLQRHELPIFLYAFIGVTLAARWVWMGIFAIVRRALGLHPNSSRVKGLCARVLTLIVLAFFLDAYILAFLEVHWPKRTHPSTPRQVHLPFDNVAWSSIDGTRIRAWWVPAGASARTAIVCHGVGAYRADMLEFIHVLNQGGYNVLAPDFRGHGDSGGHTVTYGRLEQQDIRRGLDWVRTQHPAAARRVVGVGWSMGAASLILAAAADPRIEALHLDAAYARTFDIAKVIAQTQPAIFRPTGLYLGTALGTLESGTNLFTLAPVDVIAAIAPRPIMLIHGQEDAIVPIAQGRILFAAAGLPKFWHEIPGAGHCETQMIDTPAYDERMLRFLNDALAVAPSLN